MRNEEISTFLVVTQVIQAARYKMSIQSKRINNDKELIHSDPTSCPQNQKGNN